MFHDSTQPHSLNSRTTVAVIERSQFDCDALRSLLDHHAMFHLLFATTCVDEGIRFCSMKQPSAILLHESIVESQGMKSVNDLMLLNGTRAVLILGDTLSPAIYDAIEHSRKIGFFSKPKGFNDLIESLTQLMQGNRQLVWETATAPPPISMPKEAPDKKLSLLTRRETQVLCLIAMGQSVRQSATQLGIAHSTVDNHKSRAMKKLGLHKTADLTRLAIKTGLVPME